jgi:hypothetical protein
MNNNSVFEIQNRASQVYGAYVGNATLRTCALDAWFEHIAPFDALFTDRSSSSDSGSRSSSNSNINIQRRRLVGALLGTREALYSLDIQNSTQKISSFSNTISPFLKKKRQFIIDLVQPILYIMGGQRQQQHNQQQQNNDEEDCEKNDDQYKNILSTASSIFTDLLPILTTTLILEDDMDENDEMTTSKNTKNNTTTTTTHTNKRMEEIRSLFSVWHPTRPSYHSIQRVQNDVPLKENVIVLRPYQVTGIAWMLMMRDYGLHPLLCDDMGKMFFLFFLIYFPKINIFTPPF